MLFHKATDIDAFKSILTQGLAIKWKEKVLDFMSFGDASGNIQIGMDCLAQLRDGLHANDCYSYIRPLGHIAIFALGKFLFPHDLAFAYYILTINLIAAVAIGLGMRCILKKIILDIAPFLPATLNSMAINATPILLTFLLCLGHIPVPLTDIHPAAFFIWSAVISLNIADETNTSMIHMHILKAVLLGACAGLIKQSYFFYSCIFLIVSVLSLPRNLMWGIISDYKNYIAGAIGCVPVFVQVARVWHASGELWLYERAWLASNFSATWAYPNLELVAHNSPPGSAYMTILQGSEVFWFYVYKLYTALFINGLGTYLPGPRHSSYILTDADFHRTWIAFCLACLLLTLTVAISASRVSRAMALFVVTATVLTLTSVHVELRVYIPHKAMLYCLFCWLVCWTFVRYAQRAPVASNEDSFKI